MVVIKRKSYEKLDLKMFRLENERKTDGKGRKRW